MQAGALASETHFHQPPFRFFRFKKIVVKGKWINWRAQDVENIMGSTALDLDNEDGGRGNATKSPVDPKNSDPKGPFPYDPLQNRSSRRHFNLRRGFTRIFRPKVEWLTQQLNQSAHLLTNRQPWISVREGANTTWNGLSISMRQMMDPLNQDPPHNLQMQYTITAYIEFKEFDYEAGKLL